MRHLIVVPAYNEEATLAETIADLDTLPAEYDLLVVNDGSRDRTGSLAEELRLRTRHPLHVVHLPMNCGIGVAVQTGYLFASRRGKYHYVIQFDADGQHAADDVPRLVEACQQKQLDLCVGSRFLSSDEESFQSTRLRRLGIGFFAGLISWLAGVRVTDPTSGLRCASPKAWQRFARYYPEDYPEPESLFWCARNRLAVGEIPVRMRQRRGGVSSISRAQAVYYMLKVSVAILIDRLRRKER